jgi:hypothetical protein
MLIETFWRMDVGACSIHNEVVNQNESQEKYL